MIQLSRTFLTPPRHRDLAGWLPIDLRATLHEAQRLLEEDHVEAAYVRRVIAPGSVRVFGVLTRSNIGAAYRL
ncbi:MAG: hypothetical protein ACR2RB_18510 [Gammaproteobacteria bacterium]